MEKQSMKFSMAVPGFNRKKELSGSIKSLLEFSNKDYAVGILRTGLNKVLPAIFLFYEGYPQTDGKMQI